MLLLPRRRTAAGARIAWRRTMRGAVSGEGGWKTSNRGHLYGRLRDDDRIRSRHVRGERMIYTRSRFCINLGERRRRRCHRIITKPINISN